MGAVSISVISSAGVSLARRRPGSPWMPMPISISSSPNSKRGLPSACTAPEVRARGGEHGSRAGCIEHAKAHKAAMHRLMAATATRNNPYLPFNGGVLAHNDLLLNIHAYKVRMGSLHTCKFLFDDIFWLVDQFLHDDLYPFCIGGMSTTLTFSAAICCCMAVRKSILIDCCCSGDQLCSLVMSATTSSRAPKPRWRSTSVIEVRRASTS